MFIGTPLDFKINDSFSFFTSNLSISITSFFKIFFNLLKIKLNLFQHTKLVSQSLKKKYKLVLSF